MSNTMKLEEMPIVEVQSVINLGLLIVVEWI